MYMYELFCAFFQFFIYFSLKPLTRNHSYIMVYYVFLIRVGRLQCHLALLMLSPFLENDVFSIKMNPSM